MQPDNHSQDKSVDDLIEESSFIETIYPKGKVKLRDRIGSALFNKFKEPNFTNQSERLFEEKIKEQKQRRNFRRIMFMCFFVLLVIQYIMLYQFVEYVLTNDLLADAQLILNIIIPSTLGETYIIMREMVKFVFTPGDFNTEEKTKVDLKKAQAIPIEQE